MKSWIPGACAGIVVVSLGCGLHQDPLAGKDTRFKDGRPAPKKPIYEKPVDSDAVHPITPDFVTLEEGKQTEFEIGARVLIPDYVAAIQIDNMNEFPGAVYDSTTGKFTWTPPPGFVNAGGGGGTLQRNLQVRVTAQKPDAPILFKQREVPLRVTREFGAPEVTQVTKDYPTLREGYAMHVKIRVKDMDANDADQSSWPDIQFTRIAAQKGLGNWFEFYDKSAVASHEYQYDFRLNLSDAELTSSAEDYVTGVVAYSKFGKRSPEQQIPVTVFTSMVDPVSTWSATQVFKAGETKKYEFLIMDPKQEARLTLQRFRDIPDGATMSCATGGTVSILVCTIEWTPRPDQAGTQSYVYAVVQSSNTDSRDTNKPVRTPYLSYRVDPANFRAEGE